MWAKRIFLGFCLLVAVVSFTGEAFAREAAVNGNQERFQSERNMVRARQIKRAAYKDVGGFSIQGARDFVTFVGDRMVQLLRQKSLSRSQQEAQYRRILDDHFDIRRVALYVLGGKLARSASSEKRKKFIDLFTQITVENYVDKFNKYNGQTLKLLNREVIRGRSLVVYSEIAQPGGKSNIDVQWYITKKSNGSLMVSDLKVEGVSLRHTSRKNYMGTLKQGGIDAGIARLERELGQYNSVGNS